MLREWPYNFGRVAGLETTTPTTTQASDSIAAPSRTVTAPTTTGLTSTEGVDQLTYTVREAGLYAIATYLETVSSGNAATSHFATCLVSYTSHGGAPDHSSLPTSVENALSVDGAGVSVVGATSIDFKVAPGPTLGQFKILQATLGSTIKVQVSHVVTGAETIAPVYILNISIIRL